MGGVLNLMAFVIFATTLFMRSALFTGAKGDVVTFLATDDPPHGAPCH